MKYSSVLWAAATNSSTRSGATARVTQERGEDAADEADAWPDALVESTSTDWASRSVDEPDEAYTSTSAPGATEPPTLARVSAGTLTAHMPSGTCRGFSSVSSKRWAHTTSPSNMGVVTERPATSPASMTA